MATDEVDEAREFLSEAEVAARWRGAVSPGTLRNWRSKGVGPPFVRVGRSILYPLRELQTWERRRTVGARRDPPE